MKKDLPRIKDEKFDTITPTDHATIVAMGFRMIDIHGHLDLDGLMSDRVNGVAINDLILKPCSKCGVARDKKGRR